MWKSRISEELGNEASSTCEATLSFSPVFLCYLPALLSSRLPGLVTESNLVSANIRKAVGIHKNGRKETVFLIFKDVFILGFHTEHWDTAN